jgi:glycosyltransferase involved in cell wall biosynthesis
MKVLVCTANRTIRGGIETYLRGVLPHLPALGFRTGFLFENDDPAGAMVDQAQSAEQVFQLSGGAREATLASVVDWRPDCVFNNGLADTEFELQLTRYPVVYFAHNYIGTCLPGFKRHAWPSITPCCKTMGLGCVINYLPRRCGGLSPLPILKDYFYARRQLRVLRACHRLQVASTAMREEYLRHRFAPKTVVINPYFPANAAPDPEPPARRPQSRRVVFAGRLTNVKGGTYLVEALHAVRQKLSSGPPLQLAVVGDGPELPRLRQLASRLGVPAVFHGWLDQVGLQGVIRDADLLAMPSLWPEPFGILGIEAGCLGVPSVGYGHGGIPDWLEDGISGALAPSPPTVQGLADALVRALGDAEHHHRLRLGAWQVAQRFSRDRHLTCLAQTLRSAAAIEPRTGKATASQSV